MEKLVTKNIAYIKTGILNINAINFVNFQFVKIKTI